jgi:hypothetical protein
MNVTCNPQVAAEKARDTYRKTAAQFEELARDTEVPEAMRALAEKNVTQTRELYERSKDAFEASVATFERSFDAAGERVARYAAATWGDLSADEIDALYEQLHKKGQRSIYISCNRAECSALANSFDQLFKRLGWPSTIGEGGILALGATGIQANPEDDTARLLKSAIEARTKIKVDLSGIPRQARDLNPTMLVIGTKPTDYNVARKIPESEARKKLVALIASPRREHPSPGKRANLTAS